MRNQVLLESMGSEGAMVPTDHPGWNLHIFHRLEYCMVDRINTFVSTGWEDPKEINPESENQTLLMHHGERGGVSC